MSVNDLLGVQLHYVDSPAQAERFLSWLGERRPVLAIDTETTGLEWWTPHFTRMVQFGDGQEGWALSVRDWRGVIAEALRRLREWRQPTAWHNVKFDYHALEVEGLALPDKRHAHDTYVMDHLLDPPASHRLKDILQRSYGDIATVGDRMLKLAFAEHKWSWATVPPELPAYWAYAAMDTVLTARLAEMRWPKVQAYRPSYEREMAAMWIMYDCESRGMRVDPTYAEMLMNQWLLQAAGLTESLQADGIKNPNSNKQITQVLEAAGWEPDEYTPSGNPKLDKAVLAELRRVFPGDIADRLLTLRRLLKWSKAYLEPFAKSGGRVHPSIRTLGARTGRESISGPPLQQLPAKGAGGKWIRTAVLPEEGHALYAIDYDGQELRYFAHVSGSQSMIRAFNEGLDPHNYAASLGLNKPIDQVTKDERAPFKNFRYGRLYGAGLEKLAVTSGTTVAVMEDVARAMDTAFPEEKPFARQLEQVAKERWADEGVPYVMSLGGRRIVGEGDKLYALLNYLIQGSCADLLKEKKIALAAAGLAEYIVIPVHDELLFSFPKAEGEEMAREAAGIMEELERFKVPMTVDVTGPLDNWGEKYGDE